MWSVAIVSISTTRSVSVLELAKACMPAAGRQVTLIFGDDRPGQMYEEETDAGVLEALGWWAIIDLEDGFRRLHKHMSADGDKRPVAVAYG
jgi:nucleoside-diphosphate-sugar epimerase